MHFFKRINFKKILKNTSLVLSALILLCSAIVLLVYTISTPSNGRDWTLDQAILPSAEFQGNTVTIKNIRNFSYTSVSEYTPEYYDKTFDLNELVSVDFIVEPLKPVAIAHTFVSFGFKNGDYVSVSVEIRKEKGEGFSPLRGLLDQFELMYVIADERDVIQLRALHRKDTLLLYPVTTSQEKMQELFISMLTRANILTENPEFYNTISSTCTTNIVEHINEISENRVPWDMRLLFPLDSDEYAYELGLIDTSIPFLELRERQKINALVEEYKDDPAFSLRIRQMTPQEIDAPQATSTPTSTIVSPEPQSAKDTTSKKTDTVVSPKPITPPSTPVVLSSVFSTSDMLTAHNTVRKENGVPPLQWSDSLAKSAQGWSEVLKSEDCKMRHDPNTSYGENIFWAWKTGKHTATLISAPEDAAMWWAEETKYYDYKENTCDTGEQCGHYTQMVWNDTKQLGCGVSSCSLGNEQTDVWVCRYSPAGNDGSRPF